MPLSIEEKRERNRECQRNRRAKKLYLGDMTREQHLEIVNLVFPFSNLITGDIEITHFDGIFGNYTDLREQVTSIMFDAQVHVHIPHSLEKVIMRIYPTLDVSIHYKYKDEQFYSNSLPIRNQYRVQQKFAEWKILPKFVFD
jgi:hypothetical protein